MPRDNPKPHPKLFLHVVSQPQQSLAKFTIGENRYKTPLYHMKGLKFSDLNSYTSFLESAKEQWEDMLSKTPEEEHQNLIPKICRIFKGEKDAQLLKKITNVTGKPHCHDHLALNLD